jgi:hypothetical protein
MEKMYVGTNLDDDRNAVLPRLVWQIVVAGRRRSEQGRRSRKRRRRDVCCDDCKEARTGNVCLNGNDEGEERGSQEGVWLD